MIGNHHRRTLRARERERKSTHQSITDGQTAKTRLCSTCFYYGLLVFALSTGIEEKFKRKQRLDVEREEIPEREREKNTIEVD